MCVPILMTLVLLAHSSTILAGGSRTSAAKDALCWQQLKHKKDEFSELAIMLMTVTHESSTQQTSAGHVDLVIADLC